MMAWCFGFTLVLMFIPWTQNIAGKGSVTTLQLDQRPQTIHSIIGGRIEKWYVQEGDFVNKGDTILFISEIKADYLDPELLDRTKEQMTAKEQSVQSYMSKVRSLDDQIDALIQTSAIKLDQTKNKYEQAKLKVTADSIDYVAAKINYDIANKQLKRTEELHKDGLKSLTELENKRLSFQKSQADMISQESQLLSSRNQLLNARSELTSIQAEYRNSIAKAESEKFASMSNMYDAEATVTKLQNEYMNYSLRSGMYYITAPQNGYVTKAIQSGIGETIKEGEQLVSIMPSVYDLAVEMYVKPIDLPLIKKNHKVRIQFDGWPAIVFSGWPNTSFGTFGGRIYAIDNFISDNGLYRVMVKPDPKDTPWPDALRVGAGTRNMLLLNDVPIWYELWRQINGFPPDYYRGTTHLENLQSNKDGKK
jgi:membrane fusion protein, adhesin transport system